MSGSNLGCTQPPVLWVLGFFPGAKGGALPRFRISGAVRPLSLYALVWIETAFIVKVLTVSASETLTIC